MQNMFLKMIERIFLYSDHNKEVLLVGYFLTLYWVRQFLVVIKFHFTLIYYRIHRISLVSDLHEETINLVQSGEVTLKQLPSMIPSDAARYHLFNFRHEYEGNTIDSVGK